MFIRLLRSAPSIYFTWIVVVSFSICIHEFAHAWVAVRFGDPTPLHSRRYSLNPIRVMGPASLLMLFLFGFAWGAVPVDPVALGRRRNYFLTALAGPASNLLLACGFGILTAMLRAAVPGAATPRNPFFMLLWTGAAANCFLFLFNMLPVPILDGWTVYSSIFPPLRRISRENQMRIGAVVLLALFLSPAGEFFWSLSDQMAQHIIHYASAAGGLFPS